MPDRRPPISKDEVLNCVDLLRGEVTLDDFNVPTAVWELRGICSQHGQIFATVTTYRDPPDYTLIQCRACSTSSSERWVKVTMLNRLTGGYLPEL